MKRNLYLAAGMLFSIVFVPKANAQCAGGGTELSISHDTTVVGFGNHTSTFSFPKLNIPGATLNSVNLNSKLVVGNYSYFLENEEDVPIDYEVILQRRDRIFLYDEVLNSYGLLANELREYSSFHSLEAMDAAFHSGPDYVSDGPFTVWSNVDGVNHTTYNTANYTGVGNVTLRYSASTSGFPSGGFFYDFGQSVQVEMLFRITYNYCPDPSALPEANLLLNTRKLSEEKYGLIWEMKNEISGRTYEVQESSDGRNFTTISSVASALNANEGAALYKKDVLRRDNGKSRTFYRIRQIESDGKYTYSAIATVIWDLNYGGPIHIFPNPAKSEIWLDFKDRKDKMWDVSIVGLNGQILQQVKLSTPTGASRLQINDAIPRGMYILKATSVSGGTSVSTKLFVDR